MKYSTSFTATLEQVFPLRAGRWRRRAAWLVWVPCGAALLAAETDFGNLSLEELMNETVTSVSKREQKLSDTASAVTVLSNEEIHRSGVTSIADALRLVPGMAVGSVNSNEWAISARGFNNLYANKLLVLVDGRAVYSPIFAGVYWDLMPANLEDVDRIEVIRGPGATVWGANAVNGVINVVTRGARDTQGDLLYGSVGDVFEVGAGARHGGRIGERIYYRVDAGYFSQDDFPTAAGDDAGDGWSSRHGGVRIDHHLSEQALLTWQAGGNDSVRDDELVEGRNLHALGRLTRTWSDRAGLEVQAYFDHDWRDDAARVNGGADTVDFSVEHRFGLGERQDVIWGAGYRRSVMRAEQTQPTLGVSRDEVRTDLFSVFVQDEIRVLPDRLTLTAGLKVEHNSFTGIELQPGVRAMFKPTARQTLWGAVSRAVRTPSALEGTPFLEPVVGEPFPGPGGDYVPTVVGNPDLESEVMWSYELGYRVRPTTRVSVDLALFYHDYEDLITSGDEMNFMPGAPVGTAEIPFTNSMAGETYGVELALNVAPTDAWRLTATYALFIADTRGPASVEPEAEERGTPRNQATLGTEYDLGRKLSVNAQLRHVDAIPSVPAYLTADVRIAYQATDSLEFALVGRNLLDDRHPETGPNFFAVSSEVPRSFYAKVTWRH